MENPDERIVEYIHGVQTTWITALKSAPLQLDCIKQRRLTKSTALLMKDRPMEGQPLLDRCGGL